MIIKIKNHEIELFDNTQSIPILRFQKMNKYLMMSSEIGNTFEDYDLRTQKVLSFLQKKMINEAILEMENRRQTVFNAYNEFSPRGKAFAVLIKRIDNKTFDGCSPSDLDNVLTHLDKIGLSHIKSMEALDEVKKKSKRNWRFIIRNIFQKITTWKKPASELNVSTQ